MAVETHIIQLRTRGHNQVLDLTNHLVRCLAEGSVRDGIATLFVIGSTAALTTTEFEPGLAAADLPALFERLAPRGGAYAHEATWHDDNGHSHVRASLLGPSLTVPVLNGEPTLGRWQQVVLLDFDTSARERRIVVQVLGE